MERNCVDMSLILRTKTRTLGPILERSLIWRHFIRSDPYPLLWTLLRETKDDCSVYCTKSKMCYDIKDRLKHSVFFTEFIVQEYLVLLTHANFFTYFRSERSIQSKIKKRIKDKVNFKIR